MMNARTVVCCAGVACLSMLCVMKAMAVIKTANLLAAYRLEGNADDWSGNGRHGTFVAGPVSVAGTFGRAYAFNGSTSYIALPNSISAALGGKSGATITLWFKRDLSATAWQDFIGLSQAAGFSKVLFGLSGVGNLLQAGGRSHLGETFRSVSTQTGVGDANWHFGAAVFDVAGDAIRIYIDGIQLPTTGTPAFDNNTFGADNVGQSALGSGVGGLACFKGSLDEVRIFDRVLTAAEIRSLMLNYDPSEY